MQFWFIEDIELSLLFILLDMASLYKNFVKLLLLYGKMYLW